MSGLLIQRVGWLGSWRTTVRRSSERLPDAFYRRYGRLIDTWQCTFETGDNEQQQQMIAKIQERGADPFFATA